MKNTQPVAVKTYAEVLGYCAGFEAAIDYLDHQIRSATQALVDRVRAEAEAVLREFVKQQSRPDRRRRTKKKLAIGRTASSRR